MGETSTFLLRTLISVVLTCGCILWHPSITSSEAKARAFYIFSAVTSFAALLWVLLGSIGILPQGVQSTQLFSILIYRGWIVIGIALSSVLLILVDMGAVSGLRNRGAIRPFLSSPFLLRGLCLSVSISFICTEIGKVTHDSDMRQFFIQSGYAVWFLYFVITVETFGAICLFFSRTRVWAAVGLGLMMGGAIGTHVHNRDPFSDSLEALHLLILLACIVVIGKRGRGVLAFDSSGTDVVRTESMRSNHI